MARVLGRALGLAELMVRLIRKYNSLKMSARCRRRWRWRRRAMAPRYLVEPKLRHE